ncbi:sensory neuron membrane protein 2 [Leptinotarsa decemlineata]|uniref:sensory neuron membrane protein 2 n=1 Tax=Leptinotarsa decemlineata TaxID=7539 RepID=UPI003D306D02
MKMFNSNKLCTVKILLVTTVLLLVIFIGVLVLSFVGMPLIVDDKIAHLLRLENNTEQWDRFKELPVPLKLKIFMFNVTNAEDVLNGATPILQEVGPYIYQEKITRNILSANAADDTITYQQKIQMTFNETESGDHKESDLVTIVNPVLLVLSQTTNILERFVVEGCLDRVMPKKYNKLFVTVDMKTAMLEGIEFAQISDNIGPACNIVRSKILEKTKPMRNVQRITSPSDPNTVTSLRFSFLQYKVRGPDGIYTLNRGIDDITQLGQIMQWNHYSELPFWGRQQSTNNETCSRVRGTDSTLYPPHITEKSTFDIFATDICRTVQIKYKGPGSYGGIDGYRFGVDETTLKPATASADDDCYCIQQTKGLKGEPTCWLNGVVDVFPCFGSPVLLSFPHFLYADESYLNGLVGVSKPNSSIHELYLLVEPNTGIPLQGVKRIQLNVVLRPVPYISYTEGLNSTLLPMLWIEEGVNLSPELIEKLNSMYFNVLKLVNGIKYALIAVFLAALFISTGFLIRKRYF